MPIYAYACAKCGSKVDLLVKLGATPPQCPTCHSIALEKRLSAPTLRFSGSGFYETDFKPPADQRGVVHRDAPAPSTPHNQL